MFFCRGMLLCLCITLFGNALQTPVNAQTWKTVDPDQAPLKLIDWPSFLPCRFRDGGYSANYAVKRTNVFCPSLPTHDGDRSFVGMLELQPGYYW